MQAILKIHFILLFLIYLDEMRLAIFCGGGRFKLSTQNKPSYFLETYRGLLVMIVITRKPTWNGRFSSVFILNFVS
jgi:hypothetical protein